MYGAILGDMIGAPFEFDRGKKSKKFKLFSNKSEFTDDSVMTIAMAEALLDKMGKKVPIGECRKRLPEDMLAVLDRFCDIIKTNTDQKR